MPVQTPRSGPSAMHIILITLSLITLCGIGYLVWQMSVLATKPAEVAVTDDESSRLRTELAESQRMLAEEKAKPAAITDVVVYESKEHNFRVVTAPSCENVFTVRPGAAMPEYHATARYDVFLKDPASEWSRNPFRALLVIDSEELATLQASPAGKNDIAVNSLDVHSSTAVYLSPERDFRVYGFLGGDGPSPDELQNSSRTGSCLYFVQAIPKLGQ